MNMSHCRFENTLSDLRDCFQHIYDTELNKYELYSRRSLVEVCKDILEELGATVEDFEEVEIMLDDLEENNAEEEQ